MSNNQSSVEFFYNEIFTAFSSKLSWSELEHLNNLKKQAKVIEEDQNQEYYEKGYNDCLIEVEE
jgi:hypothetical protein